jgi:hypothetical protein
MPELGNHVRRNSAQSSWPEVSFENTAPDDWLDWDLSGRMPVTFEECVLYEKTLGLRLADSLWRYRPCDRLPALLDVAGSYDGPSWLWALGELWPGFSGIGLYRDELLDVLLEKVDDIGTVIPELMSREEQAAFDALPDETDHLSRMWSAQRARLLVESKTRRRGEVSLPRAIPH